MKLYYKDIVAGKRRYTRAKPIRATQGGPLNVWGLYVVSKSFEMFIPEYLLEADGRELLEEMKRFNKKGRDKKWKQNLSI